jgi:REP element-mobilizing transposase RayT
MIDNYLQLIRFLRQFKDVQVNGNTVFALNDSSSYFAATAGNFSAETIKQYIEAQKGL